MIEKVEEYLKEFGWSSTSFGGVSSDQQYVVTYFNPDSQKVKVVILIKETDPFLYVSTHKLFKYKDIKMVAKFLEYNCDQVSGKWLTRKIAEETYVNYGFEIHKNFFTKERFFFELDVLSTYINQLIEMLKRKEEISDENFTQVDAITKDSLETE